MWAWLLRSLNVKALLCKIRRKAVCKSQLLSSFFFSLLSRFIVLWATTITKYKAAIGKLFYFSCMALCKFLQKHVQLSWLSPTFLLRRKQVSKLISQVFFVCLFVCNEVIAVSKGETKYSETMNCFLTVVLHMRTYARPKKKSHYWTRRRVKGKSRILVLLLRHGTSNCWR